MAGHADDLEFNLKLDEKSRGKVSHYRDHLTDLAEKEAQWEAAEVKASLDACECFEEFTVTDKEDIDAAAQLMEVREWRGAIAIFGFAESSVSLRSMRRRRGIRVSEVVCLDDVEVTDKEVINGLASLMEGREWKGRIKIDESNCELRKYAKEKGIPVSEVVSSPSK